MTDQLISLETAKLAKEKGFIAGNGDFPGTIVPTQSLLQKWLRDKYRIFIYITTTIGLVNGNITLCHTYHIKQYLLEELQCIEEFYHSTHSDDYHKETEEALIEALKLIP